MLQEYVYYKGEFMLKFSRYLVSITGFLLVMSNANAIKTCDEARRKLADVCRVYPVCCEGIALSAGNTESLSYRRACSQAEVASVEQNYCSDKARKCVFNIDGVATILCNDDSLHLAE